METNISEEPWYARGQHAFNPRAWQRPGFPWVSSDYAVSTAPRTDKSGSCFDRDEVIRDYPKSEIVFAPYVQGNHIPDLARNTVTQSQFPGRFDSSRQIFGTNVKFVPVVENDATNTRIRFQTISIMPEYRHKSLEELRLEDYLIMNQNIPQMPSNEFTLDQFPRNEVPFFEAPLFVKNNHFPNQRSNDGETKNCVHMLDEMKQKWSHPIFGSTNVLLENLLNQVKHRLNVHLISGETLNVCEKLAAKLVEYTEKTLETLMVVVLEDIVKNIKCKSSMISKSNEYVPAEPSVVDVSSSLPKMSSSSQNKNGDRKWAKKYICHRANKDVATAVATAAAAAAPPPPSRSCSHVRFKNESSYESNDDDDDNNNNDDGGNGIDGDGDIVGGSDAANSDDSAGGGVGATAVATGVAATATSRCCASKSQRSPKKRGGGGGGDHWRRAECKCDGRRKPSSFKGIPADRRGGNSEDLCDIGRRIRYHGECCCGERDVTAVHHRRHRRPTTCSSNNWKCGPGGGGGGGGSSSSKGKRTTSSSSKGFGRRCRMSTGGRTCVSEEEVYDCVRQRLQCVSVDDTDEEDVDVKQHGEKERTPDAKEKLVVMTRCKAGGGGGGGQLADGYRVLYSNTTSGATAIAGSGGVGGGSASVELEDGQRDDGQKFIVRPPDTTVARSIDEATDESDFSSV